MNISRLRQVLRDGSNDEISFRAFAILREIACLSAKVEAQDQQVSQELTIRALGRAEAFTRYRELLAALVRHHGLFPYLKPNELELSDLVAYESHRPIDYD